MPGFLSPASSRTSPRHPARNVSCPAGSAGRICYSTRPMQIHLKTLGCRLNEAELEAWADEFEARGHTLSRDPAVADLVVVNTCAVTGEASKKSRQMIRRARRNNPAAKLVVSGCYASLDRDIKQAAPAIDLLIDNKNKDQLVETALRELDIEARPEPVVTPPAPGLFGRGRHRAFVKIQDGCRYRCTFCVVTIARGEEQSRAERDIIREVNEHGRRGVLEVVLTGAQAGGYGSDIDSSLYRLIARLLDETDMPRIRLGSVEPWALPDHFFTLFQNRRLLPHLHLPLQSGSDRVLRRMARRNRTAGFERLVDKARAEIADFNLTTDIMVGFPGETEAEWRASLDFIGQIGFSHLHIFMYSARAGTRAAGFEAQVPAEIKKQRSRELHELGRALRADWLQQQIGAESRVLWEQENDSGAWTGYTDNFTRVLADERSAGSLENKITPVRIVAVDGDHCVARVMG